MGSNELQEIVHEIISNKPQEITCGISSDEPKEFIYETNFNEPQEIINNISLNESHEIAYEFNYNECQEITHEISFNEPQEIDTLIPQNKIEKKRNEFIEHVKNLPENQIINAYTLFSTMRYDKGNHRGEIYSTYIQKKAKEFVNSSIYKQSSSISSIQGKISGMETKIHKMEKKKEVTDLQLRSLKMKEVKAKEAKKNNISQLRSIQKAKNTTPNQLQNVIKRMIKENKKQYTPEFVQLATKISKHW
ncbi:10231_t:CDS:1 [Entrophospora sp. SA101]|nr:10231_t:CDS:1 [Entrophospora sp. SA101]